MIPYTPKAAAMMREQLARTQAINRLHEAMQHLSAQEIEQLVGVVRAGGWRLDA